MKKSIAAFLLLTLVITGCQPDGNGNTDTDDTLEGQTRGEPTEHQYNQWEGHSGNEVANHLANLCTELPDIRHATAVVLGPYAVVGLDVEPEIDQSDVGTVKHSATEALAEDPYGAQAVVTADPDITARLQEMQREIADGQPVSGIMEELAAIVGRLMPIAPGPEHRKESGGDPSDVNDQRMDQEEENEIDDIQNKQSKGRMNKGND
ncbi:YhcN/YlaJ family sporulation lipoprotein [Alteribacter populi]|uniref:YhcN/YlaJ family sporulation lipoprotein n=1 Tax=Alteribacter populi TaxID=2011011 RepID=UPI000BBA5DD4|nr:YhcN/YlaJ family sporulation lipoprotein [Alteribacter populi]